MRNGETLAQVATRFGMPVESLRAVNGLGTKARVPPGHTLLVPSTRPSSEAELGLSQAVFTTVPQGRTFYYRVNRGDTLAHIASRYDVSVQDIRRWNGLSQSTVAPGQSLRITSDRAPNVAKAKRATGRKATASAAAKPAPKHVAAPVARKPTVAAPPAKTGTRAAKTGTAAGG
jgi:LysM repeat protein